MLDAPQACPKPRDDLLRFLRRKGLPRIQRDCYRLRSIDLSLLGVSEAEYSTLLSRVNLVNTRNQESSPLCQLGTLHTPGA